MSENHSKNEKIVKIGKVALVIFGAIIGYIIVERFF